MPCSTARQVGRTLVEYARATWGIFGNDRESFIAMVDRCRNQMRTQRTHRKNQISFTDNYKPVMEFTRAKAADQNEKSRFW